MARHDDYLHTMVNADSLDASRSDVGPSDDAAGDACRRDGDAVRELSTPLDDSVAPGRAHIVDLDAAAVTKSRVTFDELRRHRLVQIGCGLIAVACEYPTFDWRSAKRLRNDLGEALLTEAYRQKRARYLAKRARRKARQEGTR
jgi:hypothetical protein